MFVFRHLSVLRVPAFVLVAGATLFATGDQKLGNGVSLEQATSIADLYQSPDKFVGKTVRVDGVVTAVCEEMGCWMALGDPKSPDATVRFKVDHDGAIVFPLAAKGKTASAEGVFEKIEADDHEAHEAAAEQASTAAGKAAEFGKTYQIKATGALIK